ncbi:MAG: hypothetical protein CMN73_08255 [Sphingomonas sp.]|nr:hypothetical protein [Sphingomonas sp.]
MDRGGSGKLGHDDLLTETGAPIQPRAPGERLDRQAGGNAAMHRADRLKVQAPEKQPSRAGADYRC